MQVIRHNIVFLMMSLLNVLHIVFCDTENIAVASSSAGVTESCFCSTKVSEQVEIT